MDFLFFLLALSVLVVVHEAGHFLAAKRVGVKVEEFGIGLPPKLWSKKIGETVFSINALPIGGFVRLYGEETSFLEGGRGLKKTIEKLRKRAFVYKKPRQKAMVVLGGVVMNLLLAVFIFAVVYGVLGIPKEGEKVTVLSVAKGSPAEIAGIKEGERLLAIEGKELKTSQELIDEAEKFKGGKTLLLVANRKEGGVWEEREVEVEVRAEAPEGEGAMGVVIGTTELSFPPLWQRPFLGVWTGFKEAFFWGKVIFGGVWSMVRELGDGRLPKDVAGPVGMYRASVDIAKTQGIWAVLHFFGVISVNLAVVNFLPLPALDGGRLLFIIWEGISRKRVSMKLEAIINNAGMIFLLFLLFLVTVGDVLRLIK